MDRYDDLFATAASAPSLFREKGALDPLASPEEVAARDTQEHALARILTGVDEGGCASIRSSTSSHCWRRRANR